MAGCMSAQNEDCARTSFSETKQFGQQCKTMSKMAENRPEDKK